MEADELDDAVQALQFTTDALQTKLDKLRVDYDALSAKLRYPGTKFLVDLEYRLVYDATISVATGGPHDTLIQTRNDLQHAIYELSARRTDTNGEGVIYGGTLTVAPSNSVQLCLDSRYATGPTRLDTYLVAYNTKGSTVSVAVKVWQRIGMGGA